MEINKMRKISIDSARAFLNNKPFNGSMEVKL
jgi:hypothetical protein